ncbi:MAG: ABC transporter ATP-binding protein/permease [Clostridia bacterium]|nr:ABC transporter ATP-binding protein/permease [Clostridia bacterium]
MKRYWYLVILTLICCVVNSVFEIFIPLIIGQGIDYIVGPENVNFDKILIYMGALAVCAVGFAVFKWLTSRVAEGLSYRIEQQLHDDIFNKFNKVPLRYIDNSSHGDLQSRMVNDVDQITDGFVTGIKDFFDCLATIVLTLVFMFRLNTTISIVIVCITPVPLIVSGFIAKLCHKLFKQKSKEVGNLSGTLVEMIGNQKIIKGFLYEDRSIEKFDEINEKLRQADYKAFYYSCLSGPIARFINGLLYATVAIMGCLSALQGAMTIGVISTFLSYANKYTRPFNEVADVVTDLQAAFASAVRVFNVLDMKDEVSDADLPELVMTNGCVDFKDVDFSYSKDKKLIQNFNLHVEKGQQVAIVGPTGCGKSTLINLLMRFYDVDTGQISVSDQPITDVTRKSLRDQYGMVLQETWLFSASIRANIAYGKPEATDAEIKRAAKLAGADVFIETMPKGYDTLINESGDNLSQGQKQLICIARLMLTKPPMLILDEATSNIDTRTEIAIQNAFKTMMKDKTSFVVAHRLSTITSSDIILVMNKGNIIEQGTHKQLLAQKGFYYNLYNSQFSRY